MELSIDFLEFRTWFLSTPMSLNANTSALEMKKNEKSERSIYSHWQNNKYPRALLEYPREQKVGSSNRISQLEAC